MHRGLISALLIAGLSLAVAAPAQAQSYRLLAGWAENNVNAYWPGAQFAKNLSAMTGGKATVTISGPEAVTPFEQMQPVSAGAFDMIYTHPTYHPKGLAGVAEIIPFDLEAWRSSGVWDFIDKYYQKTYNVKLLALVALGTEGYHCYLRAPLSAAGDWNGRKLRGVINQHAVIKALGGVPVVMPMGDVYTAMEKGVVDGGCAPANVMLATKHFEVAKYRVEPRFGLLVSMIAMNLDRWNKLSRDEQDALLKADAQTERDTAKYGDEVLVSENKKLEALGVQVQTLPPDKGKQIQALFRSANWDLAGECCGADGKQLQDIARKAKLAD
jgi:TRAP-type transport system periplasmic protein